MQPIFFPIRISTHGIQLDISVQLDFLVGPGGGGVGVGRGDFLWCVGAGERVVSDCFSRDKYNCFNDIFSDISRHALNVILLHGDHLNG